MSTLVSEYAFDTKLSSKTGASGFGFDSSASALIALLQEKDVELKSEALRQLHQSIEFCWMDMTNDDITLVEQLFEDDTFPLQDLAAAVASKFYYHIEQYEDAVEFALYSEDLFDLEEKSEYVDTIVSKCIDTYVSKRKKIYEASSSASSSGGASKNDDGDKGENKKEGDAEDEDMDDSEISEALENVVEKMFERCYSDGQHMQGLGIALESRRLDRIEKAILRSNDVPGLLDFSFNFCRLHVSSRKFRQDVLEILAKLYRTHCETPDYVNVCQCLQFLGDAKGVADVLMDLLKKDSESALVSFQVAFRIYENENQQFMRDIIAELPAIAAAAKGADSEATLAVASDDLSSDARARLELLVQILNGRTTMRLHLDFLCANNRTDLLILRKMKDSFQRSSVLHNAVVISHAFMNSGTTQHTFLRDNEQWLMKATNWARFTAIGGIGVVHKGHMEDPLQLLKPYLPSSDEDKDKKPFCEGGAYYALGLIHANKGWTDGGKMVQCLLDKLKDTKNPTVLHGACLGIGCASMASGSGEIYTALNNALLNLDDAVAGEAAAYGIGLLNVGRGAEASDEIEHMLKYAHETSHEKIIRGLSLGIALIMYGQEEVASAAIEQMIRDKDHIIRYGGCFTVAMAYAGTSNNEAIGRLLHVAVSDVSPNVRRAAVMSLGFLMIREPEKMPQLVSLLSISYCPHVRYGACIAVGVACAGTALPAAIAMLKPMMSDKVDFVRQGAFIAMAMVLMEEAPAACAQLEPFTKKLFAVIEDKHQSTMSKMGAMLALGILNAGGRNVRIGLLSNAGFLKMASVVGLMLSLQYWWWYPLIHFMSLSFTPTALIGLDGEMRMPASFKATCDAKASLFAYVDPLEEKKDEKKTRLATVELSTTAKARARRRKLNRQRSDGSSKEEEGKADDESASMDVDGGGEKEGGAATAAGEEEEEKETKKNESKPEPGFFELSNPCRVTRAQRSRVTFNEDNRYTPVVPDAQRALGIVMLKDGKPSEPETFVEVKLNPLGDERSEPGPPEEFIWVPPTAGGGVSKNTAA